MLRVFKASGEEALAIEFQDFVNKQAEEPVRAIAVKRHLQHLCGQTRFKQRLVLPDGQMLLDDTVLDGPLDVQLILQAFEPSSRDQIAQLQEAACENKIAAMQQLLERPQDPDLELGERSPPALFFACHFGCTEAVRLLMEANADKNRAMNDGTTPLLVAIAEGHLEIVRLLLEADADKDAGDSYGRTPMFAASYYGHLEVLILLLEAEADKDAADTDGRTPIFAASQGGYAEVVRRLLEAKADKDRPDSYGRTPLFMASQQFHIDGNLTILQLLMEADANEDTPTLAA
ncbi:ASB2 [Symbiodinium natans]|uniref:ASB2 protein n=1 Tax=Symbiodinium natans TaxID=878477 RepID=A0A812PIN6_9DINO|nr:ASB2 [Symbiodinium natans]